MNKELGVFEFVNQKGWIKFDEWDDQVAFLGRSEHNENFCITAHELYGETRSLFRVNHGSPFGLTGQAEYEFSVLQALRRSGVTPRPYFFDTESCGELGDGVLLMEHLAGRPLNYAGDWQLAARIFAAVHSQPADGHLIVQEEPLGLMIRECAGLEDRFASSCHSQIKAGFLSCLEDMHLLADTAGKLLADEALVMTHGAPFASDFIIDEDGTTGWLVDWENGTVASRYMDVGQFMAHASMAGEMGFCRTEAEKRLFVKAYLDSAGIDDTLDDAVRKAELFEHAAELKAMIWNCVALTGNLSEGT